MERREFLSLAALPLAGAAQGVATVVQGPVTPTRYRMIDRWDGNLWERVLMRDIRKGDVFRLNDTRGELVACDDATQMSNGLWAVGASPTDLLSKSVDTQ